MSEMEMKNGAGSEDFTDELFDEAIDREQGGVKASMPIPYCYLPPPRR